MVLVLMMALHVLPGSACRASKMGDQQLSHVPGGAVPSSPSRKMRALRQVQIGRNGGGTTMCGLCAFQLVVCRRRSLRSAHGFCSASSCCGCSRAIMCGPSSSESDSITWSTNSGTSKCQTVRVLGDLGSAADSAVCRACRIGRQLRLSMAPDWMISLWRPKMA